MLRSKKDNPHLLATKIAVTADKICLVCKEQELTSQNMRCFKGNSKREYLETMRKLMNSQFGILLERIKALSRSQMIVKYKVNMEIKN